MPRSPRSSGSSPRRPRRARGGTPRGAGPGPAAPPGGHVPVLAAEVLAALRPAAGAVVVDCTFGAGGHSRLLAEHIGPDGTLIAIDRDPAAEARFAALEPTLPCMSRFLALPFAEALEQLVEEGLHADAALLDLGMSSMQVDTRARGFAYSYDAPLDMRMDPREPLSAHALIADWDERRLAGTLRELGEERHAGAIARAIVAARSRAPISTTQQLVGIITAAVPVPARFAAGHPAKRTFQALRIAVNDELGQLERALPLAWELLGPGGALAAISFHSLEDRRVKRFMAARAQGCICPPDLPVCGCGRVPEAALDSAVTPSAAERAANPRAGSARLRVARRLPLEGPR